MHFIDVWTRRAMLARLGRLRIAPTVIDIGCSTGDLLADLGARLPDATLIGVEHTSGDLRVAHSQVPDALLLHADACSLPLEDACADIVLSVNMLQHLEDDWRALEEIYRVLFPGGRAVLVVSANPSSLDFRDHRYGHTYRYARGELARKASRVGFELLQDVYLGATLFPALWVAKQRSRRRAERLSAGGLEKQANRDTDSTAQSMLGRMACRMEELLLISGVRLPFGIRGLTVLERPLASH